MEFKFKVGDIVSIKHNKHYNYKIVEINKNGGYKLISIPTGKYQPHIMLYNVDENWLVRVSEDE